MNEAKLPRVYLAKPDVFLADALLVGQRKRLVCAQHGLTGVFPGDYAGPDPRMFRPEQGYAISRAMEDLMRGCDRQHHTFPGAERRTNLLLKRQ